MSTMNIIFMMQASFTSLRVCLKQMVWKKATPPVLMATSFLSNSTRTDDVLSTLLFTNNFAVSLWHSFCIHIGYFCILYRIVLFVSGSFLQFL